jgi:hypothetical protein
MEGYRTDSINASEYGSIIENFHKKWFRCAIGREASKRRQFMSDAEDFLSYVRSCEQNHSPCFLSVQSYRDTNTVQEIEKLFFDFDCPGNLEQAWLDAKKLSDCLKQYYDAASLIVFSGFKGYHLYAWLCTAVEVENPVAAKRFYRILQRKVTAGLNLSTMDPAVIGDIKRLSRVPYTTHETNGKLCVPVGDNREPLLMPCLEGYHLHGLSQRFIDLCEADAKRQMERPSRTFTGPYPTKDVRPCILEALKASLQEKEGHLMRIAIGREYLTAGFQVSEIVQLFQIQGDFDASKTRYYLEYLQSNKSRPFKCRTISELGFCLGSKCPFYRKSVEQS